MPAVDHSAAASALGYLYQTKWPLVELVKRARTDPGCGVALEMADDVTWDDSGLPVEMVQAKHHTTAKASLTDKSDDIWRTLQVWMDATARGDTSSLLTLVTTATAPDGSAAASLRERDRSTETAAALFVAAANESKSDATKKSRLAFLALSDAERAALVERITVLDAAPGISALDDELIKALGFVVPLDQEAVFIDLVLGWWFRQAISVLKRETPRVSALELKAALDHIRDQFTNDTLPTLVERDAFDASVNEDYNGFVFVRQMDLVETPTRLLRAAISDYYRAVTQSAKWIENNLVAWPELQRFQDALFDEWERAFEWMKDKLPPDATDADKVQAGKDLLQKCLDRTDVHIRERYQEPFYFRGKLHELADQRRAGWHPEFVDLVEAMLAAKS